MTKLIVALRNFAKVPKNLKNFKAGLMCKYLCQCHLLSPRNFSEKQTIGVARK
jgi:hypothetical protein